jgi:hypothetical protein
MSFKSTIFAATALFASAQAHIIMSSPVPYSVDKIDNSPITQSQFPCKSQNGFTVSTMNNMAVGEKQTIKFKGTAVHGGGSCQLSVTMDTNPTPDSVFKVIKSIEGGCPGVDGKTNEYDFQLPASIPNGKATFAWTWSSKMSGAPELYMNCAPIEVTGGASDKSAFEKLPDMLVYNIGEGCTSAQNFATKFPNPGESVQDGGTNDQKPPVGSCGSSGTSPAPSSPAGSPSSPSGTSPAGQPSSAPQSSAAAQPSAPASPSVPAGGAPSAPAASAPAASAPPSNPGGVFAPGASGTPTSTTLVTVTAAPTPAQPTVPASGGTGTPAAPSSPSTGGGSAPSTPGAGGAAGTCSSNGAVVCNGEKQFGLCNNGQVVWQDVASGTACVNGVISKRSLQGRVARPRYNRKVAV